MHDRAKGMLWNSVALETSLPTSNIMFDWCKDLMSAANMLCADQELAINWEGYTRKM